MNWPASIDELKAAGWSRSDLRIVCAKCGRAVYWLVPADRSQAHPAVVVPRPITAPAGDYVASHFLGCNLARWTYAGQRAANAKYARSERARRAQNAPKPSGKVIPFPTRQLK